MKKLRMPLRRKVVSSDPSQVIVFQVALPSLMAAELFRRSIRRSVSVSRVLTEILSKVL